MPAAKEEANNKTVNIGECFIYGRNLRTIFPAVVTSSDSGKAYWVFFVVTSSPLTYLKICLVPSLDTRQVKNSIRLLTTLDK